MVDPIIGGIAGAMASQATGSAIEQVREALSKSDDEREAWNKIAKECAIKAKSAYGLSASDRKRSREIAGSVGEVAHDLAIRGEVRDYDEDDIQLVRDLAQACAEYSNSRMGSMGQFQNQYKEAIDGLSEQIFEMVDE